MLSDRATEATPLKGGGSGGSGGSGGLAPTTSLDGGDPINIYEWRRIGYLGQYFAVPPPPPTSLSN